MSSDDTSVNSFLENIFVSRNRFDDEVVAYVLPRRKILVPLLLVMLEHNDLEARRWAVFALGKIADRFNDTDLTAPLLKMQKDSSWLVRRQAVEALGGICTQDNIELILPALKDSKEQVRATAAYTLGELGGSKSILFLLEALSDDSAEVRVAAINALEYIGNDASESLYTSLIKSNKDTRIYGELLKILGILKNVKVFDYLIQGLTSSNVEVRKQAAFSLGYFSDKRATPHLLNALNDFEYKVRYNAVASLAKIKDAKSLAPLVEMLKTADGEILVKVIEVLGALADKKAVNPLIELLVNSGNNTVDKLPLKFYIIDALGELGDKSVLPILIEATKDKNPDIRYQVAYALGKVGDLSVLDVLTYLQNTDNNEVSWGGFLVTEAAGNAINQIKERS